MQFKSNTYNTKKYIPFDDKRLESDLVKFHACASCNALDAEVASPLN